MSKEPMIPVTREFLEGVAEILESMHVPEQIGAEPVAKCRQLLAAKRPEPTNPRQTVAVEVYFPLPVEWSDETDRRLVMTVDAICKEYEAKHPDRVMWPGGMGAKPPPHWPWVDDGSTGDWDHSIFVIEVCERERYDGEKT